MPEREIDMDPIRVHFGPMPEMLRTIIRDLLEDEPGIQVVGRSGRPDDCLREARAARAAVIVSQESAHDGSNCLDLILAEPPLAILEVSRDGRSAAGMSLVREPILLDAGRPSGLAGAIRRLAAQLGAAAAMSGQDILPEGGAIE
jgi:DNA-binding NarL/FixJ family response regulator